MEPPVGAGLALARPTTMRLRSRIGTPRMGRERGMAVLSNRVRGLRAQRPLGRGSPQARRIVRKTERDVAIRNEDDQASNRANGPLASLEVHAGFATLGRHS